MEKTKQEQLGSSSNLTLCNRIVYDIFYNPGEILEVRIPHAEGVVDGKKIKGALSGYSDNFESLCLMSKIIEGLNHDGAYFTLQVIDPRLQGRANNRFKVAGLTTSDSNALFYRFLPLDCDPVRPSGVSSSDSELNEALALRDTVSEWIMENFHFPRPIKAMSGNGGHALFRLPDLPVNEENKAFIKNILEGLARKFNTDKVTIDTSVFNPARIWKLYGTTAQKGDELPANQYREARPHRMAYIEDLGAN